MSYDRRAAASAFSLRPTKSRLCWPARGGCPEATADDARTVRIEHGRPRYGEEITERYLVQETGQLHAVNFNKGCYLGQEIVERVRQPRADPSRSAAPGT